MQTQHVGDVT